MESEVIIIHLHGVLDILTVDLGADCVMFSAIRKESTSRPAGAEAK
jgi:hypothetical protein